ncbi:MAG: GNAT family N-acetyltransferase [Eubacteriales bacterium]|nr:GNAT family N-acetyltransferase [Eubacteriales bacterium]
MTNQEKWVEYCAANSSEITLFDQPFWLDIVCKGRKNWDVFLVEENNRLEAALPYCKKKRYGLKYISMPQLTPYNGIWLRPVQNEKNEKHVNREYKTYKLLIDQIEASGIFFYQQCYSPEMTNWQPFFWAEYKQKTLYTFWIDKDSHLDDVVMNFSKSARVNYRKAIKSGIVEEFDDIELFYKINCMTYARKNNRNPISLDLTRRIYQACKEHNAVKMLCAKDQTGEVCDVTFFAYDAKNVYALMSGTDPDKRHLNFHTLLTYEGIRFALESGRNMDFEGSMMEGVANNILRYGAELRPYYAIKKVFVKTPVLSQYLKCKLYS